jgi:CheY-like chemotaxis protein
VDGGDVASLIEADPATAKIPIVLLTASVTKQEAADMGGVSGGRAILSKLTSMKEIVEYVKRRIGP